jgi:hypothetical protein
MRRCFIAQTIHAEFREEGPLGGTGEGATTANPFADAR